MALFKALSRGQIPAAYDKPVELQTEAQVN